MTWHTGRMALFDIESTGIDAHRDRIVTAAVLMVGGGHPTQTYEWLVNPGIPIPAEASAVHGITDEQAAQGESPGPAVAAMATALLNATSYGFPVVGHNVGGYDLTMLWAECRRHGHDETAARLRSIAPVVDTFVLDKWVDTYRKGSRKLVDVTRHYGVTLTAEQAHGAAADALAAGRLAWCIAQKYPGVRIPLDELHALQVEQKRAQAESFGAYLRKQGKTDDVSRDWPVQPPPPGWSPDQLPTPRDEAAA